MTARLAGRVADYLFTVFEQAVESRYGIGQLHVTSPSAPRWQITLLRRLCGAGGHEQRNGHCKWCGDNMDSIIPRVVIGKPAPVERVAFTSARLLYERQQQAASEVVAYLKSHAVVHLVGTFGAGRSVVALGAARTFLGDGRLLVLAPAHVHEPWLATVNSVCPDARALRLGSEDDVRTFAKADGFVVGIASPRFYREHTEVYDACGAVIVDTEERNLPPVPVFNKPTIFTALIP